MPVGAVILSVHNQNDFVCAWAEVDAYEGPVVLVDREFIIYGTGQRLEELPQVYLGTVLVFGGSLVWHVYEILPVVASAHGD
jgi:hypothetical protein